MAVKRKGAVADEVSTTDLAAHLGLTTARIRQLAQEGILVRQGRGAFSFSGSVQAYIKWRIEGVERHSQSSSTDKLRDQRAREIEIRTAKQERELIHIDEAMAGLEEVVGTYLELISGLPARITRIPRERQRIEAICDEERLRLADKFARSVRAVQTGASADEADDEDDA